jgi:hypothetical protein
LRLAPPRSATAALLLVLIPTALSGCGGSSGNGVASKTPVAIVAAAKAAADSASSVHVSGSIVNGSSSVVLDLELVAGRGGRGRISEDGLSFDVIQTGGTVYISGNSAFYSHFGGAAAAQLFQGKWLKASATSGSFATLATLTNLGQLVNTALASHGTLAKKGATVTIDGQKVLGITDVSHSGTLYIATTGKPYPIEITKSGSSGGKIVFDRWNAHVVLAAPKNTIDLSQLEAER